MHVAPWPLWVALAWVYAFIAVSSLVAMAIPKVRRSPALRAPILGWWPVSFVGALATTLAVALPMLVVPALQLGLEGSDGFVRSAGGAQWVLLSTVGMFSFCARLVTGEGVSGHGGQGAGYVFFVLVMMSDATQWVGGKLLGRHALIPRVSPRKTWEGFLFGVAACALVGAAMAPSLMGASRALGAALGASVVSLGLLGDLIASGWKRDAGVKDSGAVIPGQGGLLDRSDSILFVAPWFYAFVVASLRR